MGSQNSSSSSRPLTDSERSSLYDAAVNKITGSDGLTSALSNISYDSPTYQSAGSYQGLSNSDYDALQQSLMDGYTSGIDRAWEIRKGDINQEMADRGLWSSGAPVQQQSKEYESTFLPQYQTAAANATSKRYDLQSADNTAANTYNLTNAANQNSFNQAEATNQFNNSYRPYDYLAGVWNGTGGTISSGSSGGWSI